MEGVSGVLRRCLNGQGLRSGVFMGDAGVKAGIVLLSPSVGKKLDAASGTEELAVLNGAWLCIASSGMALRSSSGRLAGKGRSRLSER